MKFWKAPTKGQRSYVPAEGALNQEIVAQVKKADDSVGPAVEEAVKGMSNGEVMALLSRTACCHSLLLFQHPVSKSCLAMRMLHMPCYVPEICKTLLAEETDNSCA